MKEGRGGGRRGRRTGGRGWKKTRWFKGRMEEDTVVSRKVMKYGRKEMEEGEGRRVRRTMVGEGGRKRTRWHKGR